MKFKVNAETKEKMVATLSDELGKVAVVNNTFPDWPSFFWAGYKAQAHLPNEGKNRDFMEDCVGEMPFVEFFKEKVRLELSDSRDFDQDIAKQPLVGSEGYPDAVALASRIVSEFASLPWQYRVTIELPQKQFPLGLFEAGAISVGEQASLNVPDLLFAQSNPIVHENDRRTSRMWGTGGAASLLIGKPSWKSDAVCFTQTIIGFVGIFGRQAPLDNAQNRLESFCGLGLAKKILTFEDKLGEQAPDFRWMVHEVGGGGQSVPLTSVKADDELAAVLKAIESFRFQPDYPEASRLPWLKQSLEEVSSAFRSDKNEKLLLAAKWFFDSFKGSDEALRYVRRMTCLEILLGGSINTQNSSLSEIMSNRLAYMIGRNYSERNQIMSDFKEVYGLRSRILHQGKHKLGFRENWLVLRLKSFCEQAIEAECKLLIAPSENVA